MTNRQLRTTCVAQKGLFKSRTTLGCQVVKVNTESDRETSDRPAKKGLARKPYILKRGLCQRSSHERKAKAAQREGEVVRGEDMRVIISWKATLPERGTVLTLYGD
jgi:hypothetical protein